MKLTLTTAVLIGVIISNPVSAINVGEITSIMMPGNASLAKEVKNTNDSARYVSISVSQLTSPLADGVEIHPGHPGELLTTPASIILPGQTKDVFRFFYKGPQDEIERYYRLKWLDMPVSENTETGSKKIAVATASAEIGTLLVVAPRKAHFDYKHSDDVIVNTGNVSFRVIAYGTCLNKDDNARNRDCRERYYVLPGKNVKLQLTDVRNSNSHIGIWYGEQFVIIK